MTLNGVMALILHYFTECGCSEAHCAKVVEDVVVKKGRSENRRAPQDTADHRDIVCGVLRFSDLPS